MRLKWFLFYELLFWLCAPIGAQTTKEEMFQTIEKTGGVYYAYPLDFRPQTKTPEGYQPFYISHYGRHGSRYLIGDNDYKWIIELFEKAHGEKALTALGEDVRARLQLVWAEAEGHGGDLTPLGVRQQRGIAERMFKKFPDVFKGEKFISARSTVVLRCAMSMIAFGDRLKELNPKLSIFYEASHKYMDYLNFHTDESNRFTSGETGPWVEEYRKFEASHTNSRRLVNSLFCNESFITKNVNPDKLMWGLYWVASDAQDTENQISFYDIFESQELFDLWQCINYRFYVGNANHADGNGIVMANAKSLVKNIIDSADEAIRTDSTAVTLRFGHDGNVIPLAALLGIENTNVSVNDPAEVYKVWSDFKIVPMAGNIQIVFYRKEKRSDDILIKALHNENEVHLPIETANFPYYRWTDAKSYWCGLVSE